MKRFSVVLVVLALTMAAAGCSPSAVTQDGKIIPVKQYIFQDIVLDVGANAVTVKLGSVEIGLDELTDMLGQGSMSPLFTEDLAEWMDWAGFDKLGVGFSGSGLMLNVNDKPLPSLAFPEGSLDTVSELGLTVAKNLGMYNVSAEMDQLIRKVVLPLAIDVLKAIQLNLTLSFQ